jgi:hypothetical protein
VVGALHGINLPNVEDPCVVGGGLIGGSDMSSRSLFDSRSHGSASETAAGERDRFEPGMVVSGPLFPGTAFSDAAGGKSVHGDVGVSRMTIMMPDVPAQRRRTEFCETQDAQT